VNVVLFIIIGLLGIKLYKTWSKPLEIPITAAREKSVADTQGIASLEEKVVKESAYDVIVQKDLFRPSRTPVKKDTSSSLAINTNEKPQLYGTTIMGDVKTAILEDPSTKTTKLYYVNDQIGGLTVSDILESKVVLKKGDSTVEIKLRAKKDFKPAKPVVAEKKKPRRTPRRTTPRRSRRSPTQLKTPENVGASAR
jgi:hypothetical protein